MVGRTHCLGGVALSLATANFVSAFSPETVGVYGTAIFVASASFGALIPDVDTNGTVAHYPVFNLIHLFFRLFRVKHRGLTHSALFAMIFLFLGIIFGKIFGVVGFLIGAGITVGVISHIFLDMLNPKGVQLLYPMPLKVSVGKISTDTIGDVITRIFLMVVSFGLVLGLF